MSVTQTKASSETMNRPVIYFCFANPPGFSGQKAATKLIIDGLRRRGWICRELPQPVRDRGKDGAGELVRYGLALLAAWVRSLHLIIARDARLHVNLGQTRFSFLRDSVPVLAGALGLGRDGLVISLHGSLFTRWSVGSLDARIFAFLLNRAGTVTVLGRGQALRLIALGVDANRVTVLPNTCELEDIAAYELKVKLAGERSGPVRLLYLSSLIDTKGYPEFLEALRILAERAGPQISAILCGRVVMSEFGGRFASDNQAATWIEEQMVAINSMRRVTVRWVKGAIGIDKAFLFHEADIFILPTSYPVEAQPIVLLEAMAAGCAIVTTRVGEIETILDEQSALFLFQTHPDVLASAITKLVDDRDERGRLASAAYARFQNEFQLSKHLDTWESIFMRSSKVG